MILEIIISIFFLTLILLHVSQSNIIEGATGSMRSTKFQDPGLSKDALYLATINAANISYLNDQIDEAEETRDDLEDLEDEAAVEDDITALELDEIADSDEEEDLDMEMDEIE
tara:strand:+ start:2468 stop:2806 length:339 start_codon:yes stop_codon:yes gene_type:complete